MHKLLTIVFDIANDIQAWFGAISAWLLRWPEELAAHKPIAIDITLEYQKIIKILLSTVYNFSINLINWDELHITLF